MTIDLAGEASAVPGARVIDVSAERRRTAGAADRHYFNAAGAGLMSDAVLEAMIAHLRLEQRVGGYEAAAVAADELARVYDAAARLLGGAAEEIAFFDSATSGLRGIFDALRLGRGDTVIAPRSSYVSQALRLLSMRKHDGVGLVIVPTDAGGGIDLDRLSDALAAAPGRVVISAVHVPTSSGLVEPIAAIAALGRAHDAITILDATQSVGHLAIDVRTAGVDALVTTGRKYLRGPRGTGFAWVSPGVLDRLGSWAPDVRGSTWTGAEEWTMDGTARRLETWEYGVAARIGLGVAMREAVERGIAATEAHLVAIGSRLRDALRRIDGVTVTDPAHAPSGIVTFSLVGRSGAEVAADLRAASIDSIAIPASHAQWDLGERGLSSVVRVSPHVYNDDRDIDALLDRVAELAASATAR
jgi:selenocysteine lyase/cysteine desulfurase